MREMDAMESALEMIRPHLGGIVAGSLLSIFFNACARANSDARRLVAGTPLYLYAVAIIFQLVVFLPTAYCAWSRWGFDTQWMKEGWTESGQNSRVSPMSEKKRFERLFLYALFGYMIKVRAGAGDLTPTDNASLHEQCSSFRPTARASLPPRRTPPRLRTTRDTPSPSIPQDMWIFRRDFLFFGHHFICLFGILAFFAIPAGVGCFVVGATVLELGNFTYNIVLLMGKDSSKDVPPRVKHFAETLYAVCMPLSNFVGATMFAWFSQFPKLKGTPWVYGLGAAWFTLIAGREHVHLSRSVPYFREHAVRRAAREKSNADAAETLKKVKKKI